MAESRVLLYRRISDRVRRIAPFLVYDEDPYLAIEAGRLVWIQDAYTTTRNYPYSTPTIYQNSRNGNPQAVKLLIEAGADVNAREKLRGTTALMWAAEQRHPEAVKVLLASGADAATAKEMLDAFK